VVGIGDTNADGCSDLVIGAPLSEAFHDPEGGAIYFFQGSPSGISTVEQLIDDGNSAGERFGRVIVRAGDTNGDGFADWCVGSPDESGVGTGPGYFAIRFPNSILGTRRIDARQLDSTVNLILKNGTSDLHDGFRVAMTGFSAAGRADLRLEVEVTDVTTGAVTTDVGPWVDPGAPVAGLGCVVSFDRLQSGLAAGGNYAWRARVAARHPMFPHGPWRTMQSWASGLEAVRTRPPVGTDAPVVAAASDLGIRVWPNPFREGLTAAVRTAAAGPVRVEVIDVAGRRIATIADGNAPAGFHEFTWDGMDTAGGRTAAGVYLLRITTDDGAESRKVIRLR
ncbi:MAG TPA: FlgD immunoglobulin-like domain containing protein, partial [bacterium]|nr:FlgD immunoglobulin-like domain containing protein [bacterium]